MTRPKTRAHRLHKGTDGSSCCNGCPRVPGHHCGSLGPARGHHCSHRRGHLAIACWAPSETSAHTRRHRIPQRQWASVHPRHCALVQHRRAL
jgi:hypothetical protein